MKDVQCETTKTLQWHTRGTERDERRTWRLNNKTAKIWATSGSCTSLPLGKGSSEAWVRVGSTPGQGVMQQAQEGAYLALNHQGEQCFRVSLFQRKCPSSRVLKSSPSWWPGVKIKVTSKDRHRDPWINESRIIFLSQNFLLYHPFCVSGYSKVFPG